MSAVSELRPSSASPRHRFPIRWLILFLPLSAALHGAAPVLDQLTPVGAALGSTNTITIAGKFDPWPPSVWSDPPGLSFAAQTNKGKLNIEIAAEAAPGPRLVRLFNDDGASEPRIFVVGGGPEIADQEPNDHFSRAQTIEQLPVTVTGALAKRGDVDAFALKLRAGEWLEARLDSHVLMGKLDAVLRLVTSDGQPLEWNHDSATIDPRLIWRAPSNQTAVLQVFGFAYPATAQVQLGGGEGAVYRLHLAASEAPPEIAGDAPGETEPNNERDSAGVLNLPGTISGAIGCNGDEDCFAFNAVKDAPLEASVEAASLGSSLDAWLKIIDKNGKELARNDDTGESRDPRLDWKAPEDGAFFLVIGSVTHRGDPSARYRLSLGPANPSFRAALAASSAALSPGATGEVKFAVTRLRGFTNELRAEFRGLPAGVSGTATNLPAKGTDFSVALITETNAPPFNGPIRLFLADTVTRAEQAVEFEMVSRTVDNGVPQGYTRLLIEKTDQFWLTVRPLKPPEKPPEKPAEKTP